MTTVFLSTISKKVIDKLGFVEGQKIIDPDYAESEKINEFVTNKIIFDQDTTISFKDEIRKNLEDRFISPLQKIKD